LHSVGTSVTAHGLDLAASRAAEESSTLAKLAVTKDGKPYEAVTLELRQVVGEHIEGQLSLAEELLVNLHYFRVRLVRLLRMLWVMRALGPLWAAWL